ncbi:NADPH:quinone oxidoreductase family protein [Marinoscillum sp.]|uniref:NADPH:quinone oxidoreductase family protein n=1 Tax=Marinoscillum sp. TaxID=2024838 RepID=UPI003BAA68BD
MITKSILVNQFSTSFDLTFEEIDFPRFGQDEVMIKTAFCGVNYPDVLIAQGKYQFQPDLPFSPGQEVSGEVVAVGTWVDHVQVGDRVMASMGWGGFTELAVAKGSNTYPIPPDLSMKDASVILESYATALYALKDRAMMKPGETLLVLGASGGTGTAAVQLGRVFGSKVIAVASTEEKRAFCLKNGAHQVMAPGEELKEQIKQLGGVDVIFDPVGGAQAEMVFRTLKPGGRHLVVGFASGEVPAIPFNLPLLKSAAIVGVFWGAFWRNAPADNRRNVLMLLRWFSEGKLTVNVTKTYQLAEAKTALEDLLNRRVSGKIVLEV